MWNYRLLAFLDKDGTIFEVRPVYYTDNKPTSFGDPGYPIGGTSVKNTRIIAKAMMKALEKPVLWGELDKFPKKYKKLKKKSIELH
jgi:hypothetical protein